MTKNFDGAPEADRAARDRVLELAKWQVNSDAADLATWPAPRWDAAPAAWTEPLPPWLGRRRPGAIPRSLRRGRVRCRAAAWEQRQDLAEQVLPWLEALRRALPDRQARRQWGRGIYVTARVLGAATGVDEVTAWRRAHEAALLGLVEYQAPRRGGCRGGSRRCGGRPPNRLRVHWSAAGLAARTWPRAPRERPGPPARRSQVPETPSAPRREINPGVVSSSYRDLSSSLEERIRLLAEKSLSICSLQDKNQPEDQEKAGQIGKSGSKRPQCWHCAQANWPRDNGNYIELREIPDVPYHTLSLGILGDNSPPSWQPPPASLRYHVACYVEHWLLGHSVPPCPDVRPEDVARAKSPSPRKPDHPVVPYGTLRAPKWIYEASWEKPPEEAQAILEQLKQRVVQPSPKPRWGDDKQPSGNAPVKIGAIIADFTQRKPRDPDA